MQSGTAQQHRERGGQVSGESFIPYLCGARQVCIMVLLAELLVVVYTLAASDLPRYDWVLLAEISPFVQWSVLLNAALLCLLRRAAPTLSVATTSAVAIALIALATAVSSVGFYWLYPRSTGASSDAWAVASNVLVAVVIAGVVLRYFYLQNELHLRERSVLQARLDVLQARIRPHFLFNTLNSIASLIETRPALAEAAVEDLADLFRASLREDVAPVTVADEVHLCERYLHIESLRLDERLRVDWQLGPEVQSLPMPSLILQPLVENAVYHGISRLPEGGLVAISIMVDRDQVVAEVCNPLPPQPGRGGMNMGLETTRLRLQTLYGEGAGLEAAPKDGQFRVRLHYPLATLATLPAVAAADGGEM